MPEWKKWLISQCTERQSKVGDGTGVQTTLIPLTHRLADENA